MFVAELLTTEKGRVPLVEQEFITLLEHLSSSSVFSVLLNL
jgi:hypothetical protein